MSRTARDRGSMTTARVAGSLSNKDKSSPAFLRFRSLVEFTGNLELVRTVSLLTLVLVAVFGFEHWVFQTVAPICLLIFVLRPQSIGTPQFWFVLALAGAASIILDWERTDNHKYLLDYWLWVLFITHLFHKPGQQQRVLRSNARFFLCLIFLAASAQKLSSPSYRSGAMFEHYLYVDSRFAGFGKLVGIDPSVSDGVRKRMAFLRSPFAEVEGDEINIPGSDRARAVALALTWWDLSLQAVVGLLLLVQRRITDQIGHFLLLFFIFTTYLPVPVFGFGWTLALMGFALAKDKFPKIAAAYVVCFFAVLVYQLPWRDWVLNS